MELASVYEKLDDLFGKQKYREAEQLLLEQVSAAEASEDKYAAISLCNELGGYYRAAGNYWGSIEFFSRALVNIEETGLKESVEEAVIRSNLATLYVAVDMLEKASEEYETADQIYSVNHIGDYRAAALKNNKASLYLKRGECAQALVCAKEALHILGGKEGYEDEYGVTNTLTAQIRIRQGRYDLAHEDALRAKECFEKAASPSPAHTAVLESVFAELSAAKGEWMQASVYHERAAEMIERAFGRNESWKSERKKMEQCKNRGQEEKNGKHEGP